MISSLLNFTRVKAVLALWGWMWQQKLHHELCDTARLCSRPKQQQVGSRKRHHLGTGFIWALIEKPGALWLVTATLIWTSDVTVTFHFLIILTIENEADWWLVGWCSVSRWWILTGVCVWESRWFRCGLFVSDQSRGPDLQWGRHDDVENSGLQTVRSEDRTRPVRLVPETWYKYTLILKSTHRYTRISV